MGNKFFPFDMNGHFQHNKTYNHPYGKYLFNPDYYVFAGLIFFLPFGKRMFMPILFSWICLVFISYFFHRDYTFPKKRGLLLLPVLFFLMHIMGFVLSADRAAGLFDLQVKLSLLLVPMLYPLRREKYSQGSRFLLWAFVIGCVVAFIYYFFFAVYKSLSLVNGHWIFNPVSSEGCNYFTGTELSLNIHPSYLALYILTAILIIWTEIGNWWKKSFFVKAIVLLMMTILLINLLLLQSRAGILGFGLLALVWLPYLIIAKRKYVIGFGILIFLLSLSYLAIKKIDRYTGTARSIKTTLDTSAVKPDKEDDTMVRFWIWKSAISVIKDHSVLGIGSGDIRDELKKQYEIEDMPYSALRKYNAHNQYLETWIGIGILGILAFLMMLIIPLITGIKLQNWLLVGFICLCGVSFFFESMLNTISGVVFFALFYCFVVSDASNQISGNINH
jgi:O-antigen ligase